MKATLILLVFVVSTVFGQAYSQTQLTVTVVNKLVSSRVLSNGPIRVMFELMYGARRLR